MIKQKGSSSIWEKQINLKERNNQERKQMQEAEKHLGKKKEKKNHIVNGFREVKEDTAARENKG